MGLKVGFKTLELETLKKAYAQTHQQLQQQILQLQTQVNEVRTKGEDVGRLQHLNVEQHVSKVSELIMEGGMLLRFLDDTCVTWHLVPITKSFRSGATVAQAKMGLARKDWVRSGFSPRLNDVDDAMLLDPPDPVDLLIAHTHADQAVNLGARQRMPLDFVRAKMSELKKENTKLKNRVADLEQTLSIVQTAQEWTLGKGMTQEQATRMQEIKALLEQAKKAREEMQNFSSASRAALYEKLRTCKAMLRRERQEKDRLMHAFDHARAHRDAYRRLKQQRDDENERWQQAWKETKERHRLELRRLHGDPAAMQSDRQDQFSYYGERVLDDLLALQKHLRDVKERTVDTVVLDGEDLEGLDHRPAADPTDGAHVMATTDAFGSEADALEADLAGDVASGAVTIGAEEAPKAPAETPKAPAEATPAAAETTPAAAETTPAAAETTPAAAETTPAAAETTPAVAETTPAVETTPPVGETLPEATEAPEAPQAPEAPEAKPSDAAEKLRCPEFVSPCQVEMAAQYANNEMKRLRSDHDQAIGNLAENMNRWNDTIRDLSKEFHDFQKVMNVNHQRLQSQVWDVQGKLGQAPSAGVQMEQAQAPSPAPVTDCRQGGTVRTQSPQPRLPNPPAAGVISPTYSGQHMGLAPFVVSR
eukprot:s412_g25.t1